MRTRWRFILPVLSLGLFALMTYHSFRWNHELHHGRPSRYFWWSAIRLDTDPLNQHPDSRRPCGQSAIREDCGDWEAVDVWVDAGALFYVLVLPSLPAFLLGAAVVKGLARLGVNEVVTFTATTPLLILAWFYFVGWLFDRWQHKRSLRCSVKV